MCICLDTTWPKWDGFKHQSTYTFSISVSSFIHLAHLVLYLSEISSSQSRFSSRQRSCSIFFAGNTNGAMNPKGSYTEVTTDKIPLLVNGFVFSVMRTLNWSDSTHHCIGDLGQDFSLLLHALHLVDGRTTRLLLGNFVK